MSVANKSFCATVYDGSVSTVRIQRRKKTNALDVRLESMDAVRAQDKPDLESTEAAT
jgi:hypothetical protein